MVRFKTSARQSSESGLLLRPSVISGGMAVERAARWATPASLSCISLAEDEICDSGGACAGQHVQGRELAAAAAAAFFCARAQVACGVWRGVAWRGVFRAPKPPWA